MSVEQFKNIINSEVHEDLISVGLRGEDEEVGFVLGESIAEDVGVSESIKISGISDFK